MTTLQQSIVKGSRKRSAKTPRSKFLTNRPQRAATVLLVKKKSPKKPNSGNRPCVKIKFNDGQTTEAYIPGEKHNLAAHSKVLIRVGRVKDLPGMKLKVVRNAKGYDLKGVSGRISARSKYGTKSAAKN